MISEADIQKKYDGFYKRLTAAADKAGVTAQDISIVAATKGVPLAAVKNICGYGRIFAAGENRAQEFLSKYDNAVNWHFIGRLQTNKVKYIIDKVSLIQSVDRLSLAEEIDKQSGRRGIVTNILTEVNIADEPTKGGFSPDCADGFFEDLTQFKNIKVLGLMCVMPDVKGAQLENFYLRLNEIYDKLKGKNADNFEIKYLSAGMSNDFECAVSHGANMVRVGRVLFGDRR